jgi:hypothetical protein
MQNSIYTSEIKYVISVLGLGGVVFDSAWGVIPPAPTKETLLEIGGRNFFTA